ncbi:MAG: hypothetical protein HQK51_13215, partial [Oligoflexia bacterium]|nr:hypothetical protein [Oligoflexia bacterium]
MNYIIKLASKIKLDSTLKFIILLLFTITAINPLEYKVNLIATESFAVEYKTNYKYEQKTEMNALLRWLPVYKDNNGNFDIMIRMVQTPFGSFRVAHTLFNEIP